MRRWRHCGRSSPQRWLGVSNEDGDFLRYLGSLGIYPHVPLTVVAIAPFGGPVTVEVEGQRDAIGRKAGGARSS